MLRSRDFERKVVAVRVVEKSGVYVRSLCRWAVAANAHVSFLLARCARGGCKSSETELALIYVRSLCRWAVAANAGVRFSLARCGRGGCKWSEMELALNLRSLAMPLGGCRERLCEFFVGSLCYIAAVANGWKRSLR